MTYQTDAVTVELLDDMVAHPAPDAGFVPLGICGDKVVVFAHLRKAVVKLGASDLRETPLKLLLGAEWYDQLAFFLQQAAALEGGRSAKSGLHLVTSHIINACQAAGPYVPGTERKTGVWLGEDGNLVINSERLWRGDGTEMAHGIHGKYVYPLGKPMGFGPETPCATPENVARVLQAFQSYDWLTPMAGELTLGWLGVAIAAGALRRRPHLLVTGPAGCGKSTLLEQLANLLGPNLAPLTGNPSWMGLHQLALERPNRAIAIDEFEADGASRRCQDAFEAARASYSAHESDIGVVRGSPDGEARTYRLSSPFAAAAISPGRMEPADMTRWVLLEARKQAYGGMALSAADAQAIGPGLARLFINRWPSFEPSLARIRTAIQALGADARMADTLGYLLASYWTFTNDGAIELEQADQLAERLDLAARLKDNVAQDEQECLTALLTRVVSFDCTQTGGGPSTKLDLGTAIRQVTHQHPDALPIKTRLTQLGLRVGIFDGRWQLVVANSPNHVELRKLFSGTKWSGGGWGVVLRRLPGGTTSTQRLGPGLPACKVTMFALPCELQPASAAERVAA